MKKIFKTSPLLIGLLLGCGQDNDSNLDSISIPQEEGKKPSLVWKDGDYIHYGNCTEWRGLNAKTCPSEIQVELDALKVLVIQSMEKDRLELEEKKKQERFAESEKHPRILDIKREIETLKAEIPNHQDLIQAEKDELSKISALISDEKQQLEIVLQQLNEILEALKTEPNNLELQEAGRYQKKVKRQITDTIERYEEEIFATEEKINEIEKELKRVYTAIEEAKADIETTRAFLVIDSDVIQALEAELKYLEKEIEAFDNVFKKIEREVSFPSTTLMTASLSLFNRMLKIIGELKAEGNTDFYEDFSTNFNPEYWSKYVHGKGRVVKTNKQRMKMDCKKGENLNEAILKVDRLFQPGLKLQFSYWNLGDHMHKLPRAFEGAKNGDGVAVSSDGIQWYTVHNADWLMGQGEVTIDLEQERKKIRSEYDANFYFGKTIYVKFQQYDDSAANTKGMEWDNISISLAK